MKKNIIYILLLQVLFSINQLKIGTIYTVEGHVQIISTDNNIGAHKAIVGKSIYSNDIIRTTSNAKCKIIYDDKKTMLILDPSSELKLSDTKKSRSIHINYGSAYLRNVSKNQKRMMIFTESNEIKILNAQVWMNSIVGGGDEIYVISGQVEVFNYKNKNKGKIVKDYVLHSYKDGFFESISFSMKDIPDYVEDKRFLSFNQSLNPFKFNVQDIDYRPHDLIPLFGIGRWTYRTSISPKGLGIDLNAGVADIANVQYNKIGIYPRYHSENLKLKFNLDAYLGPSNSLNAIDDFTDILNYLSYLQVSNSSNNFIFQMGSIHGLTFGHGNILKEYSNMLDYPRNKKVGAYLFWRTNNRDISLDIFTSSIKEFTRGGGLFGMHASLFISKYFPLTLGFSYVQDLNQFSGLEDFIEDQEALNATSDWERSVKGMGFDYTFDLFNNFFFDGYLFGEAVGIFFPKTVYYIRDDITFESEEGFSDYQNLSADLKLERGGTWELINGFKLKYRNNWDIKASFNLASAIHMPQYFGSTYEFERVRYNQGIFKATAGADDITDMFADFGYSLDSTDVEIDKFLFPKEIYMMFNSSQIKFPAVGGAIDLTYHFREIVDLNMSISYYTEMADEGLEQDSFYNYHFSADLLDNVFEGVSEARLYYTQFFTNDPFSGAYSENLLRGAKIGVKLWKNISLLVDVHDVFYDIDLADLNYSVDLVRTITAELEFRF
ncbi:MAG: hypothetical protein CMG24_06090 [Candidatus Marinimicrobia bacterium]|nr:hypothetical protein [Candidatus Neomarinimicrobiota bacterium]|tara:strand:- start:1570 stop:3726 length:2157 start_codon:yes stop_codon:yes gene_type:complete